LNSLSTIGAANAVSLGGGRSRMDSVANASARSAWITERHLSVNAIGSRRKNQRSFGLSQRNDRVKPASSTVRNSTWCGMDRQ
jgi:hypothetical protein